MTTTTKTFQVKGINDEQTYCDCCGKQDLKRVVWIENTETGDIRAFGTSCASNPAKAFGLKREIAKAVRDFDTEQKRLQQEARNAAIFAACKLASDTFPGEMKTRTVTAGPMAGRVINVPVDQAAFDTFKAGVIAEVRKLSD